MKKGKNNEKTRNRNNIPSMMNNKTPNNSMKNKKKTMGKPEVGAAREDEAVEVVGWAHGVDYDVGEGAVVEALELDVVAEGVEVAVERP